MQKFVVYNDIHLFGVDEMLLDISYADNVILAGDIVDLVNCKKSEVPLAKEKFNYLMAKFGPRYVTGNHEASLVNLFFKKDNVLFTHGDLVFWDDNRVYEFRTKTPGASFFKRNFISKPINALRRHFRELDDTAIAKAKKMLIEHECDTIVMGHKHYVDVLDEKYDWGRIIVLPRGKNNIEA